MPAGSDDRGPRPGTTPVTSRARPGAGGATLDVWIAAGRSAPTVPAPQEDVMSHVTEIPGRPTVVLVHGAFADGSSWNGVIERLQAEGHQRRRLRRTRCADFPRLRVSRRASSSQIDGPVSLVGHSYGGAVISNAATHATNVVGLVFVAAFAPDEGEVLGQVTPTSKDSVLIPALVPARTRPAAAHRRSSSWSIRRSSATRSRPTCRRSRPRSWRPRSDRRRGGVLRSRHGRRPGRTCRRGRSSRPATGPPAPI